MNIDSNVTRTGRTAMTQEVIQSVGEILSVARKALGISANELARRSGINVSNVSRMENGLIIQPSPDTLQRLGDALGLDWADLFAAAGYEQPKTLPTIKPYLRSKYPNLPESALTEISAITTKYGVDPHHTGPRAGEDER